MRFGHKTGSVTEELALVSPSKLSIDKVSKSFRSRAGTVLALDRVSLNVAEAEFVCIVGASGCGKSTLLNIIAGLEKPDSGTVLADGKPVTAPGTRTTGHVSGTGAVSLARCPWQCAFPVETKTKSDEKGSP